MAAEPNLWTLLKRSAVDPSTIAAIPPPPGVQQNFVNPPESAANAPVFVGIGIAFAGLFLIMRLYTKGYILRKLGLEDVAIALAFVFTTVTCALILEGRVYGTGRHIWDVPLSMLVPNWGRVVLAAVVLYCPSMMFAKLAVLLCYLRISPKKGFRMGVYVTMALVVAYNTALMLVLIFSCRPIAKSWDFTITTGTCVNRPAVYISTGALNVVTDFLILLLPLPMIRGLQMPLRQKLLLGAIFSVGSLACIVSIIRLWTLIPTLGDPDQTWAIAGPGNWIVIETTLAVSCGCLSVIRPFVRHHIPRLLGESRAGRSHGYSGASRYFSGSRRSKGLTSESRSRSRFSQPNPNLAAWDTATYTQEVQAKSGGPFFMLSDHDQEHVDGRDLEMAPQTVSKQSPPKAPASLNKPLAPLPQDLHSLTPPTRSASTRRSADTMTGQKKDSQQNHILKTTEVNIQR